MSPDLARPLKLLLDARKRPRRCPSATGPFGARTAPRGPIPCVRLGHRVLYDPRALQRWIDAKQEGRP